MACALAAAPEGVPGRAEPVTVGCAARVAPSSRRRWSLADWLEDGTAVELTGCADSFESAAVPPQAAVDRSRHAIRVPPVSFVMAAT